MAEELISSRDIQQFARDLRKVDDKFVRRQATKRLRAVADGAVVAAKSAAGGIPGTETGKPPLKSLLAAAVGAQWRAGGRDIGVSVRVSRAKLGKNRAGAEKVIEFGGRHMVFGNPKAWVQQAAKPWFREAVAPFKAAALVELRDGMDDIGREAGFK